MNIYVYLCMCMFIYLFLNIEKCMNFSYPPYLFDMNKYTEYVNKYNKQSKTLHLINLIKINVYCGKSIHNKSLNHKVLQHS